MNDVEWDDEEEKMAWQERKADLAESALQGSTIDLNTDATLATSPTLNILLPLRYIFQLARNVTLCASLKDLTVRCVHIYGKHTLWQPHSRFFAGKTASFSFVATFSPRFFFTPRPRLVAPLGKSLSRRFQCTLMCMNETSSDSCLHRIPSFYSLHLLVTFRTLPNGRAQFTGTMIKNWGTSFDSFPSWSSSSIEKVLSIWEFISTLIPSVCSYSCRNH